ncbi:MAG TPA: plastocyanin/azurin family copper-binding protein [Ktedonobacteraceae bacterium]|nr:plastocyanin/azurin family copper-binding protein [Ktedonobacteraceae bacterium]
MKKLIAVFVLLGLVTVLVAACGGGGSSSNTVHLTATNFAQSSITISKGSSITLVSDTSATHIISNGMWNGSNPQPKTESGAPVVSNMMFNSSGESKTIGPFNTAGTFHYYCSVHVGMNLTVVVQ